MYLGHVMGAARVHPDTIARVHDRCSPLKVIHLLTRNAEIDAGESKVMEHKGGKKWTVDKNWEKPSSVGEVIEAIMNLEALCLMIRNFSHEALAISDGRGAALLGGGVCEQNPGGQQPEGEEWTGPPGLH